MLVVNYTALPELTRSTVRESFMKSSAEPPLYWNHIREAQKKHTHSTAKKPVYFRCNAELQLGVNKTASWFAKRFDRSLCKRKHVS